VKGGCVVPEVVLLGRDEIVQSIPELKVLKKVTETSQQIHISASAVKSNSPRHGCPFYPEFLSRISSSISHWRIGRGAERHVEESWAGLKMKLARFECVIHD